MKKKIFKTILVLLMLFCNNKLFSQTTTIISYDNTSNLSKTLCNVFAPPVSVGSKLHTGVIGGVSYSDANGIILPTNYTYSTNKTNRTDYRISYQFKTGYTYSIAIKAFANVSSGTVYPRIGATLYTAVGLTYTSTSCGANNITGFPFAGSLFLTGLTNALTTYSPPNANFTSPNNFDYLLLEGFIDGAIQNVSANVYIKEIKITETAPVSFTLSATSTTITCGSTTPIAFTVTNGGNTPGITGYTWNLGSASNGWLYNGSAAPATITTGATVNTITLTPVCGSALSNVAATVTANSVNYTTNAASVAVTPTNAIIEGNPNSLYL